VAGIGKERVFQQAKRALMPARRGLLGQEQFELGQVSWSLPRWRQGPRPRTEQPSPQGRKSGLIWGIPA